MAALAHHQPTLHRVPLPNRRSVHRLDGFQLFAGLTAVVAGPLILATGTLAPGWGVLVTAAGLIVLWAQWHEGRADRDDG